MKEPIFKPGDRIYHPDSGWAMVYNYESPVRDSYYPHGYYQLVLEIGDILRTEDRDYVEKMYSFTEYDPIKGGLSHERPLPKLKMGDIVKHTTNEMYILVTSLSIFTSKSFSGVVIKGGPDGYHGSGWNKEEFILIDKRIDLI